MATGFFGLLLDKSFINYFTFQNAACRDGHYGWREHNSILAKLHLFSSFWEPIHKQAWFYVNWNILCNGKIAQ